MCGRTLTSAMSEIEGNADVIQYESDIATRQPDQAIGILNNDEINVQAALSACLTYDRLHAAYGAAVERSQSTNPVPATIGYTNLVNVGA